MRTALPLTALLPLAALLALPAAAQSVRLGSLKPNSTVVTNEQDAAALAVFQSFTNSVNAAVSNDRASRASEDARVLGISSNLFDAAQAARLSGDTNLSALIETSHTNLLQHFTALVEAERASRATNVSALVDALSTETRVTASQYAAHTNRTDNPHSVTPEQIGALPLSAMPLHIPTRWRETSESLINFYFYDALPEVGKIRSWFAYPPGRDAGESNVLVNTYFLPDQDDTDNWNAKATTQDVAGAVAVAVSYFETNKDLHADSFTNVIWRDVWSNGWRFAVAYTNTP